MPEAADQSIFGSTVRAEPGTADSFSTVVRATNEGRLTDPIQLGALWASLTDFDRLPKSAIFDYDDGNDPKFRVSSQPLFG